MGSPRHVQRAPLPAVCTCRRIDGPGITPLPQRQADPAIEPLRDQARRGAASSSSGSRENRGRTWPTRERTVTRREGPRDGRIGRLRRSGPRALTPPGRGESAGQRLVLRPPAASDRDELVRLARASRRLHRPWIDPPMDASAFRSFLRRSHLPSVRTFLAVRREDRAIVAVFTLSQIFHGSFRSAYLGYWVGATHAGRGYMTEAMGLLLRRAFGPLKLHRVEANVQPGNVASRALVRRAGFRKEGFSPRYLKIRGRWRDHERWAITVEDFLTGGGRARTPPGTPRGSAGSRRSGRASRRPPRSRTRGRRLQAWGPRRSPRPTRTTPRSR